MSTHQRTPTGCLARWLTACLVFLLAGCSGMQVVSVQSHASDAALGAPRSVAVIVENDSPPPKKEKRRAQQLLDAQTAADAIRANLQQLLTSRQLVALQPGEPADLILRCRIVDLKGGSDALRIFVGYGAGKAVLRVTVSLSDARTRLMSPLLSFDTDGTSGSMPPGAFNISHGLPKEIGQTTQSIDEQLGKYFLAQGWAYPAPTPASTKSPGR